MGEALESLMRRGMISGKAAARRGILAQTRAQGTNMEPFDGKQGRGDQGGADWNKPLDGGDKSVACTRHIDTQTKKAAPGIKAPILNAGPEKQPVRRNQIDNSIGQKPVFPKGAGYKTGQSDKAASTGYAKVKTKKVAAWKG